VSFFRPAGGKVEIPKMPDGKEEIPKSAGRVSPAQPETKMYSYHGSYKTFVE